jgi:hypothetical protein
VRQWIAIVEPSDSWLPLSTEQRARVLSTPGLAGLDIRIRPGAGDVARDCVAADLPYRLHSWLGRHDGTRATADPAEAAKQADSVAQRIGVIVARAGTPPESYGANAERDWWDHNPRGVDALDAFARRALEVLPCELDYLGFASPAWHYGRVDWDGDGDVDTVIPPDVARRFRRVLAMAYQDQQVQIEATLKRARRAWPEHPMGAYVSIGALREGRVIGRPEAILGVAKARSSGIDEITHYLGLPASWRRMLLDGNDLVRPLVERIPEIAAACEVA